MEKKSLLFRHTRYEISHDAGTIPVLMHLNLHVDPNPGRTNVTD
jgi:hypothetical protein